GAAGKPEHRDAEELGGDDEARPRSRARRGEDEPRQREVRHRRAGARDDLGAEERRQPAAAQAHAGSSDRAGARATCTSALIVATRSSTSGPLSSPSAGAGATPTSSSEVLPPLIDFASTRTPQP